jgi:glycosyltransferase involved in cell wall biosynthesis
MDAPLVSIIMPIYNYEAYLVQAIRSVTSQTFCNFELVACDDGSTDRAWELALAEAQADQRIRLLRNEKNRGIAATRQRLLETCRGRYVGHLDCDDFLERWAVEEMLRLFGAEPELALVYTDSAFVNETGNVTGYKNEPDFSHQNLMSLGWRHFGMYRRDLALEVGGFNLKLTSGCDDGDLFMRIATRYPCRHLAKVLYYYRCHSDNRSRSNKKCDVCEERDVCNYFMLWSQVVKQYYPDYRPPDAAA